jgi:hypothetical protein
MKKYFSYLYIATAFIIILTASCKEQDKLTKTHIVYAEKDFPTSKPLAGNAKVLEKSVMPANILVIPEHNLLVILEMKGDYLAKAYTLDSLRFLKYFVKKGEGPKEQLTALTLQYKAREKLVYISDLRKKRIFAYSVESLKDTSAVSVPVSSISVYTNYLRRPLILDNDRIVELRTSFNIDSIGVLNFYNQKGEFLFYKGTYPAIAHPDRYTPYEWHEVFMGCLSQSADGSKIILNYYTCDVLDLYDTTGNLLTRIQGPDNFDPDLYRQSLAGGTAMTFGKNGKLGYTGQAKMKDELLVLYDGNSAKRKDYHVDRLLHFDKELKPSTIFKLDSPIFAFDIDWNTRTLYGLTHKVEGSIVTFKL